MVPFYKAILNWQTHIPMISKGVVIHETADNGDNCKVEKEYLQSLQAGRTGDYNIFAHVYCDATEIVQFAPLNMQCYHACDPANEMFIGIEFCHVSDGSAGSAENFAIIYESVAEWTAYYLRNIVGTTIVTKDNVMSHEEVSLKWHNSTHVDPTSYFAMYGKTMDMFRAQVQFYINSQLAYNNTKVDTLQFI